MHSYERLLVANVSMESDEVSSSTGSLFHVAGPDTVKLRRPMVVLIRSTTSVCHLPTTDESGVQTSARWDGARPCRHW